MLLLSLSLGLSSNLSRTSILGILILDRGLLALSLLNRLLVLGSLDRSWLRALLVDTLDVALDTESLGVGELNVDVLALETGELAVQVVGVRALLDVELGVEGLHDGRAAVVVLVLVVRGVGGVGVGVVVVEEAEEGGEARGGRGLVEGAREECHCVFGLFVWEFERLLKDDC